MSSEASPPRPAKIRPQNRRSATDHLRTALMNLCDHRAQVLTHSERAWASITFAGTRHRLALLFAGPKAVAAGDQFIACLPEHEFAIPGQLVADAGIVEVEHRLMPSERMVVQCDLLLLEES